MVQLRQNLGVGSGHQNFSDENVMDINQKIDQFHNDYLWHAADWKLIRTCLDGERAVKESSLYACGDDNGLLPYPVSLDCVDKTSEEFMEAYKTYLSGAIFTNYTLQSLQDLVSGVFRRRPRFDGLDDSLGYIDLTSISREIIGNVTGFGRAFAVVEYPDLEGQNFTPERERELGIGANIAVYDALSVEDWTEKVVYGKKVLTRVKINDSRSSNRTGINSDPSYSPNQDVEKYIELILEEGRYVINTYTKSSAGTFDVEKKIPVANHQHLTEIPGTFIGVMENTAKVDASPILGIANANIHHYRTWAEWIHQHIYAGHPEKVISGLDLGYNREKELKEQETGKPFRLPMGASNVLLLEGDSARAELLEINGNNLMAPAILEQIERSIANQGGRIRTLNMKGGVESAKSLIVRSSTENSMLGNIVTNTEHALKFLFKFIGLFMNLNTDSFSAKINKEYSNLEPDGQLISSLSGLAASNPGYTRVLVNYLRATNLIETSEDEELILESVSNANAFTG